MTPLKARRALEAIPVKKQDLAKALGVKPDKLSRALHGVRANMDLDRIVETAKRLAAK